MPAVYHVMLAIPNMLLMNIMASRVFRDTNLGYLKQFHVENDNILHSQLEGQINTNRPPSSVEPIQFRNGDDGFKASQSESELRVRMKDISTRSQNILD